MTPNETVVVTETSTDDVGTTITEVTTIRTADAASGVVETSLIEEIIEAIIDDNPDAEVYTVQEYVVAEGEAEDDLAADEFAMEATEVTVVTETTDSANAFEAADLTDVTTGATEMPTIDHASIDPFAVGYAGATGVTAEALGIGTAAQDTTDTMSAFGGVTETAPTDTSPPPMLLPPQKLRPLPTPKPQQPPNKLPMNLLLREIMLLPPKRVRRRKTNLGQPVTPAC
jgi:hypothetical protein